MLLIEPFNRTVRDELVKLLTAEKIGYMVQFDDFDGVKWLIFQAEGTAVISISLLLPGWDVLKKYDYADYLKNTVKLTLKEITAAPGFSVNFETDLTDATHETCLQLSKLHTHLMMPPFLSAFEKFDGKTQLEGVMIPLRPREFAYICSNKENICVVFAYDLPVEDQLYGEIVLREMGQLQKTNRNLSGGPPAFSYKDKKFDYLPDKVAKQGGTHWVEFVMFKQHFKPAVVEQLIHFRSYISSHIKSTKTFVHGRMRTRVREALQVLERAKPT